ncbi:MAG: SDR family NAD(P)-dependent oxidoreductase [Gammaproteobacteria bacterium]|jgi:NAD(P)-dependent dehydrogenase (short-subunit alcohol dehydrogenase family)|nr:SDR family NAD(P)-dependent oxidoreductase [Gammaproteobacteria bacterium]
MGLLEGKVALVTGAGGGLGETHALLLAQEGAAVVVNDLGGARDGSGGGNSMADQVVEKIKAMGGQAVADYGNVAKEEDANKMVQTAVEHFGKLDFLIANAGILRDKAFKNMTNEMWDIVLDVHLRGTYLTVRAAYNQMMNQESGGSIVVTSSTSGLLGNFGQTNYGAAKAGIAGFARCLFQEGMKYGIRVNVLAPAAWSRLTEDIFPQGQNMAELLSPDKVSPLVVWLGSDDAKDVTGRTFLASGNTVQLLSWQSQVICQKDNTEGPFSVADIGEAVRENFDKWPKGIQPTPRPFE